MRRVVAAALALVFASTGSAAAAEPSIVRELIPGAGPTLPFIVGVDGDLLYFSPAGVPRTRAGIWQTDGTKRGTRRVYEGTWDERPDYGVIIACLTNPDDLGPWAADGRLWHCPGDPTRPEVLSDPGWRTVGVQRARLGDTTLMIGYGTDPPGPELWASDGSVEGTSLVRHWETSDDGTCRESAPLFVAGDRAYFLLDDGVHGCEIWVTDGTAAGTTLLLDMAPGSDWGFDVPEAGWVSMGGMLYVLRETSGPGRRLELWRSDGTTDGTRMLRSFRRGDRSISPQIAAVTDGAMYFAADDGVHGLELWTTDGTFAGTRLVRDIKPDGNGFVSGGLFCAADGKVFFTARPGKKDDGLWVTDGTADGTRPVPLLGRRRGALAFLTAGDSVVVYDPGVGRSQESLWITDGTRKGTRRIKGLGDREGWSPEAALAGDTLYFPAHDDRHGAELWKLRLDDVTESTATERNDEVSNWFGLPHPACQGIGWVI